MGNRVALGTGASPLSVRPRAAECVCFCSFMPLGARSGEERQLQQECPCPAKSYSLCLVFLSPFLWYPNFNHLKYQGMPRK